MKNVARDREKAGFIQNKHDYIGGKVLDVGCGQMPYKRVFWNPEDKEWRDGITDWVGLDVRPVGDIEADACMMPGVGDEQFDTVLCIDVLHEVANPFAAVSEMWRVLKPGGHMMVAALNTWPDDGLTFWNFKSRGLAALIHMVTGTEALEVGAGGSPTAHDRNSYLHRTKYGVPLPEPVVGMLDAIDQQYPLMSFAIVKKETPDDRDNHPRS